MFSSEDIEPGALLAVWGGCVITTRERHMLTEYEDRYTLQIGDDHHLACTVEQAGVAEQVNHSCNPNAGLQGPVSLVAMQRISTGEQVCFDYAMSEADPQFAPMTCVCGEAGCRGVVDGNGWTLPSLRHKYAGYFSPYIARRIRG